jgi:hypothetical protein
MAGSLHEKPSHMSEAALQYRAAFLLNGTAALLKAGEFCIFIPITPLGYHAKYDQI